MPRSRSRSIWSINWARISRGGMAPVNSKSRSASVLLPWSIWAMMQKLRIWSSDKAAVLLKKGLGLKGGQYKTDGGQKEGMKTEARQQKRRGVCCAAPFKH